ncbi:MAG: heavy metal translocating P-type ATPase [Hyphomicrobium sp.]
MEGALKQKEKGEVSVKDASHASVISVPPSQRETQIFAVPSLMCGGCIHTIEKALLETSGIFSARANLSARRVSVTFDPVFLSSDAIVSILAKAGFSSAVLVDNRDHVSLSKVNDLLPRVGVAGFAAGNIMLLSVSVWSGLASDMDQPVQSLFHWISALIGVPAIAYSGQPFFVSALGALRHRRLNMDVPISLGIILATLMSFLQTMRGTEHVYFDAATMLVFFLLIGRLLDESMRARTRSAAENLLSLKTLQATIVDEEGNTKQVSSRNLKPHMKLMVAAGERIAADGIVLEGASDVDQSLITGETLPKFVTKGDRVHAGTLNTNAPLTIETTATDENTLLAELARLMQAGEQARGRYVRLADRAARLYAPAVHLLGLATFLGWMFFGAGWETALTNAISVLIITCPCALALAVPAVQVAAISRLFSSGILVKTGDGLERLAETDSVILDKTGTLSVGEPELVLDHPLDSDVLARVAGIAVRSRHPYAQAMVRKAHGLGLCFEPVNDVNEVAGSGLLVKKADGEERLGSAQWVGFDGNKIPTTSASLWYVRDGRPPLGFRFEDRLREDAQDTILLLQSAGYHVEILSGDREGLVAEVAHILGVRIYKGGVHPEEKLARLNELKSKGFATLMVGDGLNDAPALASGYASMSPSAAADISQNAADVVFQGERLGVIVEALKVARRARAMAFENFAIALLYNLAFIPLAVLGYVTPLLAALAMSTSSIFVTANALRLRTMKLSLPPAKKGKGFLKA